MSTVYVLTITTRHGGTVSVHRSPEKARDALAGFARTFWAELTEARGPAWPELTEAGPVPDEPPGDNDEAIAIYFRRPDEFWEIADVPGPDPVGAGLVSRARRALDALDVAAAGDSKNAEIAAGHHVASVLRQLLAELSGARRDHQAPACGCEHHMLAGAAARAFVLQVASEEMDRTDETIPAATADDYAVDVIRELNRALPDRDKLFTDE